MSSLGKPLIIVGAGRSGTNMLRDLLTSFDGLATWPCDEINYIWRYGNRTASTDELDPATVNSQISSYIRSQFNWVRRRYHCETVVEKTCANSLRVPFVETIVPESNYLFIVRDGRDVVASAMKRWRAQLDLVYLLKKARFVPITDIPYYALRYGYYRTTKIFSAEKRVGSWGPRYEGMDSDLLKGSIIEIAGRQWQRSVKLAWDHLEHMDSERRYFVTYEDFVKEPKSFLMEMLEFAGHDRNAGSLDTACSMVRKASIGKWKTDLNSREVDEIESLCGDTLKEFEYL